MATPAPRPAAALLVAGALAVTAIDGSAEPATSVIRDDRLGDLGATPSLGRGYSPGANTLHSVCMDRVATTRPSFDFDYVLEEEDQVHERSDDVELRRFVAETTADATQVRGRTRLHVHHLVAWLSVDSYYSTIDEAQSELSPSVLALLRASRLATFFSACGTHYLRSISRRSVFVAIFSYASATAQRDLDFERRLEEQVMAFDVDGIKRAGDRATSDRFDADARQRSLRIVSKAIGLSPDSSSKIIAFDLPSYRTAVAAAFKAFQDEHAGRITAIEVAPWLANPTVLATIELPAASGADAGAAGASRRGREHLWLNAELLGEVRERVARGQRTLEDARSCRLALDQMFDDDGELRAPYAGASLVSKRGDQRIAIARMRSMLADPQLAAIAAAVQTISTGHLDYAGADACLAELDGPAFNLARASELPACRGEPPPVPHADTIAKFCPPQVAPTVITVVHSGEKRAWLEHAVGDFDALQPGIEVRMIHTGTRPAASAILAGTSPATLWSPASSVSVEQVRATARTRGQPSPFAADLDDGSLVSSPIVLLARADGRAGRAERPRLAIADPRTSMSGAAAVLQLASRWPADPDLAGVVASVDVAHTATAPLTAGLLDGRHDMVATYENLALAALPRARERGVALRMVYPDRTTRVDYPIVLLDDPRIDEDERAAARALVRYLRGADAQELAIRYGLRPSSPDVELHGAGAANLFAGAESAGLRWTLPPDGPPLDPATHVHLIDAWTRALDQRSPPAMLDRPRSTP